MIERLRAARDDKGAMLIIALLVVTSVALVTGAMLAHGQTNFRATVVLREVAGTSYASDAAAKVAINDLRLGSTAPDWSTPGFNGMWNTSAGWVFTNNSDGAGCFGATGMLPRNALELNKIYPKAGEQTGETSVRVQCTPVDGTGILGSDAGVVIGDPDAYDPFAQALTTVGTSADPHDGAYFNVLGTGNSASAPIGGGVESLSTVTADHGDVTTDGYVWANGSCTGGSGRVVSPDTECPKPGGVSAPTTPASPLTGGVPTFQDPAAVTDCQFVEGYYNSAQALSDAVNACPTAYFAPGKYYFDFRDGQPWNITTKVIGGVPTGSATMPGACKSPIKYASVQGVQFVFGGSSTIFVDNTAQVELCGPSNGGDAPLTVYQQQTGTTPTTTTISSTPAGAVDTAPSSNPNKTDAFVVDPVQTATPAKTLKDAVQAVGDSLGAKWTSTKNGNGGELRLSAFPGLGAIPRNASIDSASVHVDYSVAPPASVAPIAGVAGVTGTSAIGPSGDADVTTLLQTSLRGSGFNSTDKPTVQVKIPSGPKDATATIDRVTLTVTWSTATLRPSTDTTFIATKNNSPAKFIVQGATYAPDGYLTMFPGNSAGALVSFRWGLVAQGVSFNAQPQQLFGYPLVSVPVAGHGMGSRFTAVDLEIFVCVSSPTCSTGGTKALTTRVLITDPPYNTSGTWTNAPQPGRRQIRILSWAEER